MGHDASIREFVRVAYGRLRPMSKPLSTPNGSPRKKPLPAALAANLWKPGQSGNPGGKGGTYYEMMRLARQFTPQATQILIDIASDPGEEARSRIVAIGMLYDRAWGKPKDYDPAMDKEDIRPRFDPSLYTPEQLAQIETTLRLVAVAQAEAENGR
jgi:hypothetical protein